MNLNIELPLNIHKNVVIEQKANIYNIILCSIAKKKEQEVELISLSFRT